MVQSQSPLGLDTNTLCPSLLPFLKHSGVAYTYTYIDPSMSRPRYLNRNSCHRLPTDPSPPPSLNHQIHHQTSHLPYTAHRMLSHDIANPWYALRSPA